MVREIERKDERPDSMSAADRDKINQFSRLLTRRAELEAKLKSRQKIVQLHEDASDEMCLLDDSETVPHAVGDVFFVDTCEQVTAIVEATKEELQQEMTNAGADIDSITARLGDLKRTLYAKFGNTINLEE